MTGYGPIYTMLEPYLGRVKRSGRDNVMGHCPLPDHDDNKPSFAINLENGMWMCHGCHRSGGLVTLLRLLGISRQRIDRMTKPVMAQLETYRRRKRRQRQARLKKDPLLGKVLIPEAVSGIFDWMPLDLVDQGFKPKVLQELGVGYDRNQDRIMYPIRDTLGNLAGFSGRATVAGDEPRYKVYTGGYREAGRLIPGDYGPEFDEAHPGYEIDSHDHLWNGHRVYAMSLHKQNRGPLIIVEGFKACIWLIQHGYPNTVALMGSHMSKEQHLILHLLGSKTVVLMLDNDVPGIVGTLKIGKWLLRSRNVWVASYYPSWVEEPDGLNGAGLTRTIESMERYAQWKARHEEQLVQDVL